MMKLPDQSDFFKASINEGLEHKIMREIIDASPL